jgi:hypothetical protein
LCVKKILGPGIFLNLATFPIYYLHTLNECACGMMDLLGILVRKVFRLFRFIGDKNILESIKIIGIFHLFFER